MVESSSCPGTDDDQTPSTTTSTVPRTKSALARGWKRIDSSFLKPLLTNSQPTLEDTMPWLGVVARWLTPTEQIVGHHITRQSEEGDLICNNFNNIQTGENLSED